MVTFLSISFITRKFNFKLFMTTLFNDLYFLAMKNYFSNTKVQIKITGQHVLSFCAMKSIQENVFRKRKKVVKRSVKHAVLINLEYFPFA